mgnify:CR=1 FL=1|jgi:hypothetical protein
MLLIVKSLLSLLDILFPETIIRIVKHITPMFNKDLTPMYDGRVLMNQSAMNDPAIIAALNEMAKRDFAPLPTPNAGVWNISDRH